MASSSDEPSQSQLLQADDDEDEFESPYQVYKRLIDIVINETIAPEILPFEESIVDCIVDQVQYMSDNLKKLGSKLGTFCIEQHQMELERFRFVINKYYRTRLEKIEKSAANLVSLYKSDRDAVTKLLSTSELKFLDNYVTSMDEYLNKAILNDMPSNMKSFELEETAYNQQLENDTNYVFVKAVKKTSVMVDDPVTGQEVVVMDKGSKHFLPFSAVRPLLQNSSTDIILL